MDMANLSNRQQADMFVAQQQIQALFTDQAADNAMKQFNATSQNQVDQFFASLTQTANQFNASQLNAQEQFNAGQVNTIERFNAEIDNQRDQFNAQNQLVIAQSNANWRRQIATADTAATNRANELNAQNEERLSIICCFWSTHRKVYHRFIIRRILMETNMALKVYKNLPNVENVKEDKPTGGLLSKINPPKQKKEENASTDTVMRVARYVNDIRNYNRKDDA
jgi:glucose dehydrogenase